MIIVRLQGGLGNQLFQYAAGKAMAAHTNSQFKLDGLTSLGKNRLRSLELDNFNLQYQLANLREVRKFIAFPSLYRHRPSWFARLNQQIYRERDFSFDPNFFSMHDPVYLDGYWQSPKYFENIQKTLEKELEIKKDRIIRISQLAQHLQDMESVSIHIRRGDFTNPKALSYHGILGKAYYEAAMQKMTSQFPNCTFCFFSDDITWVKENLAPPRNCELISTLTTSSIEDFYLMSVCRHNVIANSSFSWWAAWLNKNPDKEVIAPKKWFVNQQINTNDLIPADWKRI